MQSRNDAMRLQPSDIEAIVREAARRRLLNFARYIMPSMVVEPFHRVYYDVLDRFAHGGIRRLIVTMPPQHGKSQGSTRFLPAFLAGLNPALKIAVCSYSDTNASDFNRDVQRIMDSPEYRAVFPLSRLASAGDTAYQRNGNVLDIVGAGGSIRFVGRGGALTSKAVDVVILDDLYKDYAEANSPTVRESVWKWYTSVVRTRLDNGGRELVVFTRWHTDDLIGRLENQGEEIRDMLSWGDIEGLRPDTWARVNFEAIKTGAATDLDGRSEGAALWEAKHSRQRLESQKKLDPMQFECLYQGNPGSAEGRLYQPFKTYTDKGEWGTLVRRGNYTDVADEGNDFLVSICYDIYNSGQQTYNERTHKFEPLLFALITDVIMTDADTEQTTVTVPEMINRNGTQKAWIESNNGGAQFEKAVRKKVRALTVPFHQSANKESRIITAAGLVNASVIMPTGWESRWPKFHEHITGFLRNFKANAHDDPEDALTGVYEKELADGNTRPYGSSRAGIMIFN